MEDENAWSFVNLLSENAENGASGACTALRPELQISTYSTVEEALEGCADADLVIVHEWNDPALVAALGTMRKTNGRFTLLFHDTHHRAVSDPKAIRTFDLSGYDAVLAFGETLAAIYRRWGWGRRVFVWHEAADISLFHPPHAESERSGLVWIGNWGDGERTREIETFLLSPAREAGLPLDVHGVRYPEKALSMLRCYGARYHGWLANALVPSAFARHLATIHVPRRFYARRLPGIPTIRIFEALACGIPLLSAPWEDSESLFRVGEDFIMVDNHDAACERLREVKADAGFRTALAAAGWDTIRTRHTCAHRVDQLFSILGALGMPASATMGPAA
jgi:spore maturation protein CgeB